MTKSKLIGLADSHIDCGACLFEKGKFTFAMNEERISRKKKQGGFPHQVLNMIKTPATTIIGGIQTPPFYSRLYRNLQKENRFHDISVYKFKLQSIKSTSLISRITKPIVQAKLEKEAGNQVRLIEHHAAHAGAYYTSPYKKALCITADACGDGLSLTINKCNKTIERIQSIGTKHSYGLFFSFITKTLGFRPDFDEGKILGLASYGDATKIKIPFPFTIKEGSIESKPYHNRKFLKSIGRYKKEDLAAWLQVNIEKQIQILIRTAIKKTGLHNIVLSGGLFANIRLNQVITEMPEVKSTYVFPHMGDGGLPMTAILAHLEAKASFNPYLGTEYESNVIEKTLQLQGFRYKYVKDIENYIAKELQNKRIVARFAGRMEVGPRALGNRSILANPSQNHIKKILNKKLKREKFMPFSPTTLAKESKRCYLHTHKSTSAAYMTNSFTCTEFMTNTAPGAVHIDGTARPQILKKSDNPGFYKIIEEFYKGTGIPSIINTSFNLHGEPIVCTPKDALRAFKKSGIDILAIENFVVRK